MNAKISQFFTIDIHYLRQLIRLHTFKQAKKSHEVLLVILTR